MPRLLLAAAVTALALPASVGSVGAQTDAPVTAVMSALALQPMPEERTIEVVTYDDSDLARAVGAVAGQALASQGFQVGSGGRLQLGIELRDELQVGDRAPTLGSANVERGEIDDNNVRVNIFADNQDSVLGGRVGPTTEDALRFGLYVTLNDRSTGRRIWQAEIMGDIGGSNRESAAPLMTQAVLQRLGAPVSQERLVLG